MNKYQTQTQADEFKHIIEGIGPAIEKRLHQAGITTYAQLGESTVEEIYPLVEGIPGMSVEKIAELDWPGQARKLAQESTTDESLPEEIPTGNRQHEVSFTVKLLLNEDHSVRAVRVADNRSKTEEHWAAWDENRLIDFIVQSADLLLTEEQPTKMGELFKESKTTTRVITEPVVSTEAQSVQTVPESTSSASLGSTLQMRGLEIVPIETNRPGRLLRHGMPLGVYFDLDLTEVKSQDNGPLKCMAAIYAKKLGHYGQNELVGELNNSISPGSSHTVRVPVRPLKQGSYRLQAVVTLTDPSSDTSITESTSRAFLDGGIVKVY